MDIPFQNKHLNPLPQIEEGSISDIISKYPHVLDINDSDVKEVGNYYLPFSTGFEIECDQHLDYDETEFTSIEHIMEVRNDSHEQRYRIPSGINGLRCLYDICYKLHFNCVRTSSGIHYQVDCTDWWDMLVDSGNTDPYNGRVYHGNINKYKEIILKELDTWDYKGTYNHRDSNWFRLNSEFKTIEFRIGEMSFDYDVLFKRIVHCNAIVRYIKEQLQAEHIRLHSPILSYAKNKNIKDVLKNRIEKI
jgi:hypothetical protein